MIPGLMAPPFPPEQQDDEYKVMADIRTGLVAALVAVGTSFTVWFGHKTYRLTEAGHLTDRFEGAAKQIGDNNETVRAAGVYALAQLADIWPNNRQACIDVLCMHIRSGGPIPGATSEVPDSHSKAVPPAPDSRRAALEAIVDRLRAGSATSWSNSTFNLRGAHLDSVDFRDVRFDSGRLDLRKAVFSGTSNFGSSRFNGAEVWFDDVILDKGADVRFTDTHFVRGAVRFDRMSSPEHGSLSFENVTFHPGCSVTFAGAQLGQGEVSFDHATIAAPGPTFAGARFCGTGFVTFNHATFAGTVSFAGAFFNQDVTMASAQLGRAKLQFAGANFQSGRLDLSGADIHNATLSFDKTRSTGGHIDLRTAVGTPRVDGDVPMGLVLHSGPLGARHTTT
ncbi:pentapeptide repeat-containing protein [Rhodococcus sp. O3]|uniref:pentapeptide repeat-containing protein n=1 Tax=Rhodococcus sp. O3 TaxID=3404919 RepID=UPI003B66BBDB